MSLRPNVFPNLGFASQFLQVPGHPGKISLFLDIKRGNGHKLP